MVFVMMMHSHGQHVAQYSCSAPGPEGLQPAIVAHGRQQGCHTFELDQRQNDVSYTPYDSHAVMADCAHTVPVLDVVAWSLTCLTHLPCCIHTPTLSLLPCPLCCTQLRQLGRTWSLSDVAQRKYVDNGWIAVDGKVYDITEHIATHPGWDSGCRVTEVLSIIAHLGQDCSQEFHDIHRSYPVAYRQLAAYYIGELETDSTSTASS